MSLQRDPLADIFAAKKAELDVNTPNPVEEITQEAVKPAAKKATKKTAKKKTAKRAKKKSTKKKTTRKTTAQRNAERAKEAGLTPASGESKDRILATDGPSEGDKV